ncbi:MAG: hypothetical protein A2X86_19935 [Bdellovibrionales bacterium GWA2_49_15]|nr:MAG: hypothetical protein A2X86_19935 [Bdellovibrionales bacterium GWA2_49_15]HAZ12531.1 hypothetical protein [Bdellovibrionales bacterium]
MHKEIAYLSAKIKGPLSFPFILQGSDEAGRGPLAGPVVASTVSLLVDSPDSMKKVAKVLTRWKGHGVNDSKKLSSMKRRAILSRFGIRKFNYTQQETGPLCLDGVGEGTIYSLPVINDVQAQFKIVSKSASYIDLNNILNASLCAMWESGADLHQNGNNGVWYFDGNRVPKLDQRGHSSLSSAGQRFKLVSVIRGDSQMLLIGLASIIAKEYRDFVMSQFANLYPEYGLEKHAGYPTLAHREALKCFGPSPIHRRTFKGVSDL